MCFELRLSDYRRPLPALNRATPVVSVDDLLVLLLDLPLQTVAIGVLV